MAVLVDKNTKVICQGITGSQGTFHSEQATWAESGRINQVATAKLGMLYPRTEDVVVLRR